MTGFPTTADEEGRLCALRSYDVLDSPPEVAFERISDLAARLLGVPIVLVSLVDAERQWFKATRGVDVQEMPRQISFCTFAILSDDIFVVPDATLDPRFAENPLVTGSLGVRFYAGAPLVTPDGRHRLGTLCVIDRQPRTLNENEQQTLRDLAAVVVDAMEHRREARLRERAERELAREQGRRYRQLVEEASDAFFIHDFQGRVLDVNQAACDGLGYERQELLEMGMGAITVEFNLAAAQTRWERIPPGRAVTCTTYHQRKDRGLFPVEVRLSVFRDEEAAEGTDPRRVFALVRDVTERKRAEDMLREANDWLEQRVVERTEALNQANTGLRSALAENSRLAAAIDSVSLGVVLVDACAEDLPIVFVNPAFTAITGYPREEVLGRNCRFLQGAGTDPAAVDQIRDAIRGGKFFRGTLLNHRKDGTPFWNELSISPVDDGPQGPAQYLGVQMDVTSRQRVEERLRLLESVVVNAHDAVLIVAIGPGPEDAPRIVYANRAFEHMTGYAEAEILGQTPGFLRGTKTSVAAWNQLRNALARHESVRQEMLHYRKDGTEFWVETNVVPVADAHGQFTHSVSVLRDITERKQAENDLRDSEGRYRQLFNTNPLPTWVYERGTLRFLEVNEAAVTHYGYTRAEFLGMSLYDLLTPGELAALRASIAGTLPTDPHEKTPTWNHRKKSGEEIVVEVVGHNFIFTGLPARLVVVHDVTEQRRTLRALRESESRFERITANVPGMVFRFLLRADGSSQFTFASEGSREIYGLEPEEVMADPRSIIELVPPEGRAAFAGSIADSAITLRPWRWEGVVQADKPGFPKHLQATSRPERTENGDTVWDGVVLDVTERRRNEDLERAKEAAERSNAAKSEFLSRMSHELRTPLNAILGFGQLLELDDLTPPQVQSVEHILKGGRHLLGLIDEVLDISRIETGHLGLTLEPVEVQSALRGALSLVRHMTHGRSIRLLGLAADREGEDEDLAGVGKMSLLADPGRLKQVLLNLLSNAIKYNRPGGEVELGCLLAPPAPEAPGPGFLRITVRDTGEGITPEQIEKLFTPFERLDAAQGPIEGVGLGLAVSKRLAEAMGGTLGVCSTPGAGSTFWVELPRADNTPPAAAVPVDAVESARLPSSRRLLYIEDNPPNLQLVQGIFERQRPDWELLAAPDGTRGLELARSTPLDLILLDLQLPGLSGEAVLAQLRADLRTRDLPVILLSADANPQSYARLMTAGANAYLTKPLDVRAFLAALDETLDPHPA